MPDYFQSDCTIYIFPPELYEEPHLSTFLSTLSSFWLELPTGCEVVEHHGLDVYLVAQGLPDGSNDKESDTTEQLTLFFPW